MLPPKSILQLDHARSFWAQRLVPAKNPLSKFQAPRTLHRGFEFNPVFCRGSKPPPKTGLSPATKNLSRFESFESLCRIRHNGSAAQCALRNSRPGRARTQCSESTTAGRGWGRRVGVTRNGG